MIVTYHCPECGNEISGDLTPQTPSANCPACGVTSRIPPIPAGPGVVLGGEYRIDEALRSSSVGYVFRGMRLSDQSPIFVKLLPRESADDEDAIARFQREVKIAAAIQHPNLLSAIEAGSDNGTPYLISPFREGRTLGEILRQRGTLPELDLLRIALPIARALQCMWDQGHLVHRNVKPETILLPKDGEPLLTDLGIARSFEDDDSNLTRGGFTVGTPQYMSPEACLSAHDLDYLSDMYSLGITMYQALAGRPPFDHHSPMVIMRQHVEEQPPPIATRCPDLSSGTADLVHRLIAKNRADRPASWQAVIDTMIGLHQKLKSSPRKPPMPAAAKPQGDMPRNIGSTTAVNVGSLETGATSRKKLRAPKSGVPPIAMSLKRRRGKGGGAVLIILILLLLTLIGGALYWAMMQKQADYAQHGDPAIANPTATPRPGAGAAADTGVLVSGRPLPPVGGAEGASTIGAAVDERFDQSTDDVLQILLSPHAAMAPDIVDGLAANPDFQAYADQIRQLRALAQAVAQRDQILTASFQAQVGQEVKVRLGDERVTLILREINGDEVHAEQHFENGYIGKKFRLSELHSSDVLERMGSSVDAAIRPALEAVILYDTGRRDRAREKLAGSPAWIDARLLAVLESKGD